MCYMTNFMHYDRRNDFFCVVGGRSKYVFTIRLNYPAKGNHPETLGYFSGNFFMVRFHNYFGMDSLISWKSQCHMVCFPIEIYDLFIMVFWVIFSKSAFSYVKYQFEDNIRGFHASFEGWISVVRIA